MGFSVLQIWPMFGSVFRFSHSVKAAVFQFWGLPRFAGFLEFSLWFSVFFTTDGGFSDSFCPVHFAVFLVLPRKLHPAVALKPVSNSKGPYIAFYPFF